VASSRSLPDSGRVRAYTLHLARQVSYPLALVPALAHAALLHDIGKIAVGDAILLKPGKLSEADLFLQVTEATWLQIRDSVEKQISD